MKEWFKTPESHEQLAVGETTSRSISKTKDFLKEMEKKVNGNGNEGEDTGN